MNEMRMKYKLEYETVQMLITIQIHKALIINMCIIT